MRPARPNHHLTTQPQRAQPRTPVEHHGIDAYSSTAPETQNKNQTEIKIPSTAARWIQVKQYAVEFTFESSHLSAERWLCCAECHSRFAEGPQVRDGREIEEVSEFHE